MVSADVGVSITIVAGVVGAGMTSSVQSCIFSLVTAGSSFEVVEGVSVTGGGPGSVLSVKVIIGGGQTCGTVAREVGGFESISAEVSTGLLNTESVVVDDESVAILQTRGSK